MADYIDGGNGREEEGHVTDQQEYELMLHLERLESLREEMEELGISSLAELERKIDELHRQLDRQQGQ